MNALKSVELLKKYSKCPKCGSELIGNGEGTLDISDDILKRTCECGWRVEVDEDDVPIGLKLTRPGIYKKGNRTRICLGQEGFFVYYKTPSKLGHTAGLRIDLWKKWAKSATYEGR
ncbi:DUF3797 domain-containing protein [Desulfosporosinus sp. FKA]|uniref:DUF3797 domain-containing protein n=1 Tax=Desulfosporosinus sp. FKA TaxID=1969834 RepID=UPI001124CE41|nr:DUF3797 domain-containing protein [Desulfosporosinus sp. FKA]